MSKHIIPFLCAITMVAGCKDSKAPIYKNLHVSPKNEDQKHMKESKMTSEAIVIFKKGVSYDKAMDIIESYGMEVKHYYRTLSKRRNRYYMLLKSSLPAEKMLSLLKADPSIQSVSLNYERSIDTIDSPSYH